MSHETQIISRKDLHDMIREEADFTLIEVLSEESYEDFHLPGAINIPGNQLRERVPEVVPDKSTRIVVYCSSPACTASDKAAVVLKDLGYENVQDYRGGKEHWKEGGLPIEEGAVAAV